MLYLCCIYAVSYSCCTYAVSMLYLFVYLCLGTPSMLCLYPRMLSPIPTYYYTPLLIIIHYHLLLLIPSLTIIYHYLLSLTLIYISLITNYQPLTLIIHSHFYPLLLTVIDSCLSLSIISPYHHYSNNPYLSLSIISLYYYYLPLSIIIYHQLPPYASTYYYLSPTTLI